MLVAQVEVQIILELMLLTLAEVVVVYLSRIRIVAVSGLAEQAAVVAVPLVIAQALTREGLILAVAAAVAPAIHPEMAALAL